MESSAIQPSPQKTDALTIAQLAVSGLGMVFSLLSAGGLVLLGLVGLFGEAVDRTSTAALFSMAWISLLVAILAVPSFLYSLQRLTNGRFTLPTLRRIRPTSSFLLASALMLLWPLVLILGNVLSKNTQIAWLVLPPLQILAVLLPVWWLFEVARLNLSVGDNQRGWGLINFTVFITTPLLMIVEVLVIVVLIALFAVWLSSQPALLSSLQRLLRQLSVAPPSDPQRFLPLITPLLRNPLVIFSGLALMAGVVPLLEELLKPLGVWALAGRRLTPREGFVAGALCGASFALIESLFYLSNPAGQSWAALAVGRAGTGLLHITTTSLVGWALAEAWQNGAYLRLGLSYLAAAALHGLWNGLSIVAGLGAVMTNVPAGLRFLTSLGALIPCGIGVLIVSLFTLLWGINRHLRNTASAQTAPAVEQAQNGPNPTL